MCSCRKHGLKCVSACGHCNGTECSNGSEIIVDIDENTVNTELYAVDNSPDPDNGDLLDFCWADDVNVQFVYEEEICLYNISLIVYNGVISISKYQQVKIS